MLRYNRAMKIRRETHHDYYQDVPDRLVKQLSDFRQTVYTNSVDVGEHCWTFYELSNQDESALLLLHGGGGDAEAMFRYIKRFSRYFRVIAPNIPPTIRTIEDTIIGLRRVLSHIGIERCYVVGMSFGAMLAQMYIRRFMNSVIDLVVTHAVIPSAHLAERTSMQKNLMMLYPEPLLMWISKRAYRNHIDATTTPAASDEKHFWQAYFDEIYSHYIGKRHLLSRAGISANYHASYEFNSRDLLEWNGDMLIIESDNDNVISEGDRGSMKAMYSRAYIQSLLGYDHLAPLLASEEMASSILNFLRKED